MYKSKTNTIVRYLACFVGLLLFGCTPTGPTVEPSSTPEPVATASAMLPVSVTPGLTPTASLPVETEPACSAASLDSGTVGLGLLDKPMDYHVLLPPCYTERTDQRYPVLYLLHGQNFTQQQWIDLGVAESAGQLMLAGEIPPYIIVLPFDHSYKQPREYRFEQVFIKQLIPEIDQNYRTLASSKSRAIGGLSRGGAWAIYLTSRHPDLFGIVGAHSPAVFYSNTSALPVRLRDIPPEQKPVFYVDAGDKDIDFQEIQKFTTLLNDLNILHEWHYNLGFHDEKYWSGHVEEYLYWYGAQFDANP
jgi:enterochelin esterase-like enzyme